MGFQVFKGCFWGPGHQNNDVAQRCSWEVVPLLGDAIAQLRHDDLIDEWRGYRGT